MSYRPCLVRFVATLLTLTLARSNQDGALLGLVYVEYSSLEEAKAAERALNSGELASQIGGVQVTARFAAELHQLPFGGNDVPCKTLYLGRVPSKVLLSKDSLLQPFETYGTVVDLRIREQSLVLPSEQHIQLTYPQLWNMGGPRDIVISNLQDWPTRLKPTKTYKRRTGSCSTENLWPLPTPRPEANEVRPFQRA